MVLNLFRDAMQQGVDPTRRSLTFGIRIMASVADTRLYAEAPGSLKLACGNASGLGPCVESSCL